MISRLNPMCVLCSKIVRGGATLQIVYHTFSITAANLEGLSLNPLPQQLLKVVGLVFPWHPIVD